jgi:hypothetical protein
MSNERKSSNTEQRTLNQTLHLSFAFFHSLAFLNSERPKGIELLNARIEPLNGEALKLYITVG